MQYKKVPLSEQQTLIKAVTRQSDQLGYAKHIISAACCKDRIECKFLMITLQMCLITGIL